MEMNLWAPWRMAYIRGLDQQVSDAAAGGAVEGPTNFLVAAWKNPKNDIENLVVHRDAQGLLMLNRYPYSNGHLMVALGDARPRLLDYSAEARSHFWHLVDLGAAVVEASMHPHGLNIGVNQSRAGGAGLPEHVHAHVVPRWNGDTNFMPVLGSTTVLPEALQELAAKLRQSLMTDSQ